MYTHRMTNSEFLNVTCYLMQALLPISLLETVKNIQLQSHGLVCVDLIPAACIIVNFLTSFEILSVADTHELNQMHVRPISQLAWSCFAI